MTDDALRIGVELAEKAIVFALFERDAVTGLEARRAIETLFGERVAAIVAYRAQTGRQFSELSTGDIEGAAQ